MDEREAREAIVDVGRRMWQRELVAANDGNISVRLGDDRVLCTPTSCSKGRLRPDELSLVRLDGTVLSAGAGRGPSSEIRLHLSVYRGDPAVGAVVHAHPLYATAFAIRGEPLTALLMPETVVALPEVPLAPYATPSTDDVPASVAAIVAAGRRACLLEQHGALTWAPDLEEAYLTMERLEFSARMTATLRTLGEVRELEPHKVRAVRERFGIASPGPGD
jgi:L-fuculose-phosphate aldolase